MNRHASCVAMSCIVLAMGAGAARAGYDNTWDYIGNSRSLALSFMADTTVFAVNRPPMAIEPDPTGDGIFSIADSVRRAALSWNASGSGWMTKFGNAGMGDVQINVRMGFIDPLNAANNEFSPPSSNDANNDNDGSGAGGGNTLAFFRITGRDATDNRYVTSAEIVFNPFVQWGIGTNAAAREDMNYDPIIVALHEIGHALRLDHTTPGGSTTIGLPRDGDVMRPISQSGWHQTNKNVLFDRNPNMADINVATMSFNDRLPAPGAVSLGAIACLGFAKRRRA